MKLTLADLFAITFMFIAGMGFTYLACDALDKEEQGRQQMISHHNFNLKYGE